MHTRRVSRDALPDERARAERRAREVVRRKGTSERAWLCERARDRVEIWKDSLDCAYSLDVSDTAGRSEGVRERARPEGTCSLDFVCALATYVVTTSKERYYFL